jgi:hypothetical protein
VIPFLSLCFWFLSHSSVSLNSLLMNFLMSLTALTSQSCIFIHIFYDSWVGNVRFESNLSLANRVHGLLLDTDLIEEKSEDK